MNKAVFLDRDGVINVDKNYVYRKEDFELKDSIVELLQYLTRQNFKLFVVTNQSGIGRGYYSAEDFLTLTEYMIHLFEGHGVKFEEVYYCPETPEDEFTCRKPNPFMVNLAIEKYDLNRESSWLIGDKESDIKAANNAGIFNTVKVLGKEASGSETHIVKELHEIKALIK